MDLTLVKDCLRKLNSSLLDLPSRDAHSMLENELENLKMLSDHVLGSEDKNDLESFSNAIFNKSSGLLYFLDTRSSHGGGDPPQKLVERNQRKRGFEMVQNTLQRLSIDGLLVQESLVSKNVFEVCLHTFRSEKAFEECIEPLFIILQATWSEERNSNHDGDSEGARSLAGSSMLSSSDAEDLFDSLAKSLYVGRKDGVGIKRQKLRALGLISNRFPSIMKEACVPVKKLRLSVLIELFDSNIKSSENEKKEQQVMTGCLEGLSYALGVEDITAVVAKKSGMLDSIFSSVFGALSGLAAGEMSRYHLPVAALSLLTTQTDLFKDKMSRKENCVELCKMLLQACRHQNKDIYSRALKAYEAFLGCARLQLVEDTDSLNKICKQLQDLLQGDSKSRCLSLRGFGSFATAIKSIKGAEYLKELWIQVANYMDSVLGQGEDVEREEVSTQLPSLIIAFADIMIEMDQVEQQQVELLDRLLEAMFKSFPSLIRSRRFPCYQAWFFLLYALDKKGTALQRFLDLFIFRSLVVSIQPSQDPRVAPPGMPVGLEQKPQPCMAYCDLWKSFLTEDHRPWMRHRGHEVGMPLVRKISMEVYDRLFVSVAKVVDRLDMSVAVDPLLNVEVDAEDENPILKATADSETVVSRPVPHASCMTGRERPSSFEDMDLFLNLVDMFQMLMSELHPDHFRNSYFFFCKCMVDKSKLHPLISGFFKLLTAAMKVIDRGEYLAVTSSSDKMNGGGTDELQSEAELLCAILSRFAQEVVLRCNQFFQDLLAASLEFILSLPVAIRTPGLQVPALKSALKMGISHSKIADVAFDGLESMVKGNHEDLRSFLPGLLPLLDAYLVKQNDADDVNGSVLSVEQRNRKLAAMLKRGRKMVARSSSKSAREDTAFRAVRLLGKLGCDNSALCNVEGENLNSARLDTTLGIVKVRCGLQRTSSIMVDMALPRIVYLAQNTSDRQCKVSSCELLHALCMCVIGEHARAPSLSEGSQRSQDRQKFDVLFRFLFPALLRLAVDTEVIASKLFEPLVNQIVHWFTSKQGFESEAQILLDAILECVESQDDGRLRESSSKWLAEFVRWTLKGLTTDVQQENASGLKNMLRRLYGLLNHPNVCKRLGGYSAIQYLSASLAPYVRVVDQFLLEIFHHLILSLRFVGHDDQALDTERSAVGALVGLEKILFRKKYLEILMVSRQGPGVLNRRRVYDTISSFVTFLFEEIVSREKPVRRYCRQLFVRLCPKIVVKSGKVTSKTNPKEWIQLHFSTLPCGFDCSNSSDLENFSGIQKIQYMKTLNASCDGWEWMIMNEFLGSGVIKEKSPNLFDAIRTFAKQANAPSNYDGDAGTRSLAVEKAQCLHAVIKLIATIVEKQSVSNSNLPDLEKIHVLELVFVSLLCPGNIGLDIMTDPVVASEIPKQVLRLLSNPCFQEKFNGLSQQAYKRVGLANRDIQLSTFHLSATDLNLYQLLRMFRGFQILAQGRVLDVSALDHAKSILKCLSDMRASGLNFVKKESAEAMLSFALKVLENWGDSLSVWSEVFADIKGQDWRDCLSWKFYERFRLCFDSYLSTKFAECPRQRDILFKKALKFEFGCVVLGNLLEHRVKEVLASRNVASDSSSNSSDVSIRLPRKQDEKLVMAFQNNFSSLDVMISTEDGSHVFRKQQVLDILARMIFLAPNVVFDDKPENPSICSSFVSVLRYIRRSRTNSVLLPNDFQLVVHILKVLPGFANFAPKLAFETVSSEVSQLLDDLMPLASSKLLRGEARFAQFQMMFSALMDSIRNCRNGTFVLKLIREHLFIDRDHIFMQDIVECLNDYVLSLNLSEARGISEEIIQSVQARSHGHDSASLQIQRSVVIRFGICCMVRLRDLNRSALAEVFAKYSSFLLESMQACVLETLSDLSSLICVLNILITFYRSIDYTEIKQVVHEAFIPTGADRNMHYTQLVLKALMRIRKVLEPPAFSTCPPDLADEFQLCFREFHQMAQNTFMTVVRRTQEKANFVDLVFKDCAWDKIVDAKTTFRLERRSMSRRTVDSLAELKNRQECLSLGIHASFRRESKSIPIESLGTLSLDIGDVSSLFLQKDSTHTAGTLFTSGDNLDSLWKERIELESDQFNDISCMTHFLLLMGRINEKSFHITEDGAMPVWMKELRNMLEDFHPDLKKTNEINVRLFVAKLILNSSSLFPVLFRSHARAFFRGFFDRNTGVATWVVKQGETLDKIPGSFNYLLKEFCLHWSTWMFPSDGAAPFDIRSCDSTDQESGWNFIHQLMKVCPHKETFIAKSNVELLALFVQKWKVMASASDLSAAVSIIQRYLTLTVSKSDESNVEACRRVDLCNSTGIQLLNLFLIQELQEVDSHSLLLARFEMLDLRTFFDQILHKFIVPGASANKENRKSRARRLLRPAAHVCGHIIACFETFPGSSSRDEGIKWMTDSFKEKVRLLRSSNQLDHAIFAASSAVSASASLAIHFVQLGLENLVKLHGEFQCLVLGMIVEYVHQMCKESKSAGPSTSARSLQLQEDAMSLWSNVSREIPKLLEKQDEKLQLLALQLFSGRDDKGKRRLQGASEGREGFFAFLTAEQVNRKIPGLLQLLRQIFMFHRSEICRHHYYLMLMDLCEICDAGTSIPEKDVFAMLAAGPGDSSQRIQHSVLDWWNDKGLAKEPPPRLVHLVERMRFDSGLRYDWVGCSAWLMLSACKQAPEEDLFDKPLQDMAFKELKIASVCSGGSSMMAPLFAGSLLLTQQTSLAFRASQSLSADGIMTTQMTEISTQFEAMDVSQYMDNQTQLPPNHDLFLSKQSASESAAGKILANAFSRKRVASDASADSQKVRFARRHEEIAALRARVKNERANRVEVLRTYRQGEVPDVQIKRNDVLRPLQHLVLLDSEVARIILVQLVSSLESRTLRPESLPVDILKLEQEIVFALRLQNTDSADVVEALLDIAHNFAITVPAGAVVDAGDKSMNYYKSIQVLERQALSSTISPSVPVTKSRSKKRGAEGSERLQFEDSDWFSLSRLYSRLGEHDIVRGLYEKFSKEPDTHKALHLELLGDFEKAKDLYASLREKYDKGWPGIDKPSELEVDLWDKGIKDCLQGLQMWDEVREWIRGELEFSKDICDEESNEIWNPQQKSELDLYIQSLVGNVGQQSFADPVPSEKSAKKSLSRIGYDILFDVSGKFARKAKVLESDLSCEAALALLLDDCQFSSNKFEIVKKGFELVKKKYDIFLERWGFSGSTGGIVKHGMLRSLQQLVEIEEFLKLSSTSDLSGNAAMDLISDWQCRLPRKQAYEMNSWSQILCTRLALLSILHSKKGLESASEAAAASVFIALSSMARKRGNSVVAVNWLERARRCRRHDPMKVLKSALKTEIKFGIETPSSKLKIEEPSNERARLEYAQLLALQGDVFVSRKASDLDSLNKFRNAVEVFHDMPESSLHNDKVGEVFLKLAEFCNNRIKDSAAATVSDSFPKMFIENVMRAMTLGCSKAAAHVPRILEIVRTKKQSHAAFLENSQSIPVSSVVDWLPQLFSEACTATERKDKAFCAIILPLLKKLAKAFPQTVYFNYRVVQSEIESKSDLSFVDGIGIPVRVREAFEKFGRSLQLIQEPTMQLQDFVKGFEPSEYKFIYEDCLDAKNPAIGQARKEFAREMQEVARALGADGRLAKKPDIDKAKQILQAYTAKSKPSARGTQQLLQLSTALGQFDGSIEGQDIIVPRQIFGDSAETDESKCVKIVSFDPSLLTLSSLRKPKRIIMRGSDGKEYWWLVKMGEDLRQDQRVEQVFHAMNRVLQMDSRCSRIRLRLATYDVVPISKSAGIIEWVQYTRTVNDMIESGTDDLSILKKAKIEYGKLYPDQESYKSAIMAGNKAPVVNESMAKFESIQSSIPSDTLRKAIFKLAGNAKMEFDMRNNFATSLATICPTHYLLGIGDRHLQNILLLERTGSLLGIDFGHAFGSAVQLLPIPELMPFRLTRQFLGVLAPLDAQGLLKRSMTYVLGALRSNKDTLLETMKIFVEDPSLDWKKYAQAQANAAMNSKSQEKKSKSKSSQESASLEVAMKLTTGVKQKALEDKFAGIHPRVVMLDELAMSQHSWIIEAAAKGGIRALLNPASKSTPLEPFEQVEELVLHAMDPKILCHTWIGWSPYL